MYEKFGPTVSSTRDSSGKATVTFQIFFPNTALDPLQYVAAGQPKIKTIQVIGTFQASGVEDIPTAPIMVKNVYKESGKEVGHVYEYQCKLVDGYYEYRYFIEFENGRKILVGDPCAKYSGTDANKCGFVVGGTRPSPVAISNRKPLSDLVIYELMIDDFTQQIIDNWDPTSPTPVPSRLKIVQDKLDHIKNLGFNAIEFMPWTGWPGKGFSWGYDPAYYFAAEYRYTNADGTPLEKISWLRNLINECHNKDIHVIMDIVLNHSYAWHGYDENGYEVGYGFPYYWMYQDEFDCPYVGTFAGMGFGKDLDCDNECTQQFIADVCKYWMDQFEIDGFRLDYTLGLYRWDDRGHGLNRLMFDLRTHIRDTGKNNFVITLEHLSDNRYESINVANQVGATGCWYDPFFNLSFHYLWWTAIDYRIMRMLNSAQNFAWDKAPVTYISNHDHSYEYDQARGDNAPKGVRGRAYWWKVQPYVIALFTIYGAPLIRNGAEFAEDHSIPDSGSDRVKSRPLRWELLPTPEGQSMMWLYNKLIDIRHNHPALRGRDIFPTYQHDWARKFNEQGTGVDSDRGLVIYHRWRNDSDPAHGESYVIVLNFSSSTQNVDIPFPHDDTWEDLISGWKPIVSGKKLNADIGSNWGHIFYSKR